MVESESVTFFFLSKSVENSSKVEPYPKVFAKLEQCLLLWLSCTCDRIRKENVKACRVTLNLNSLAKFKSNAKKQSQIMDGDWQCCYRKWEMLSFLYGRASRGQSPRLIGFFKLSSIGCSPHSALLQHQLLSPNPLFSNNSNHCLLHHGK